MSKKEETPLEEIRRIRRDLDDEMKKDPKVIHRTAQKIQKKYGIRSVKLGDSSKKRDRGAA